ncbi:QRFP-like peptide receptor [Nematostella vectensis]|uniref:QRFP-like peptide receptor n=1 Tax=Nematostella vectensis TaxID=45351 RepID=UPI00207732EA|nr:QRFP-like peptide receptor [Nematostella vectensis]XP_032221499.2 QRFP-like peptide receptor [Nematostella vectensis]XP_032221500.2 QRFP-like peptide receptor [Nematostella vectensis]
MTTAEEVAIVVAFSIVTVIGVTGNILVCLVVLLNKPMRTPMNYLLVNLAISDLLLLIFFSPTFIFKGAYTHPGGLAGDVLCSLVTGESFAWMGGYASALFLVAIAIERFYAVTNPHSNLVSITNSNLKILVVVCWLFAIAWNAIGFIVKRYNEQLGFCTMEWPADYSFKVYSALCFVVLGVIPICTMCVLYSRVIHQLWFRREVEQVNNQEADRQRRKKATKMVIVVSFIYALSWIPELSIFLIVAYAPTSIRVDIAYPASVAMVTFNSAINPIIYSFHNERFRRHLLNLLRCRVSGGRVAPNNRTVGAGHNNTSAGLQSISMSDNANKSIAGNKLENQAC